MSSELLPIAPGKVDKQQFRRACGRFATGISIATALGAGGEPHGLTVNSFTSVSLEPPLVLICIGHNSTVIDDFRRENYFGINILHERQEHLSAIFARKGHDRFEGTDWFAGETGVPLLRECLATLECAVHQRFVAGDHDIIVGEVVATAVRDGDPLLYYGSEYRRIL